MSGIEHLPDEFTRQDVAKCEGILQCLRQDGIAFRRRGAQQTARKSAHRLNERLLIAVGQPQPNLFPFRHLVADLIELAACQFDQKTIRRVRFAKRGGGIDEGPERSHRPGKQQVPTLVQITREVQQRVIDRRSAGDRGHVVTGREAGVPKQSIGRRWHGVGQQKRNQPHNEVYQPRMSDVNFGRYLNDTR